MRLPIAAAFLLLFLPSSLPAADLQGTIEQLIAAVEGSGCSFIRNGREHTTAEAAKHLHEKYDHFRKKIHTPEDFIRLAGTRSELSGDPYLIRCGREAPVPSADWLAKELARYRRGAETSPAMEGSRR